MLVIVLALFLILLISLAAAMLVTDHLMTERVVARYKQQVTADVLYRAVDGAELAYRRHGQDGLPLLMIHGFMGSSYDYASIFPTLAEHYQVIAVDLIGFGLSDKSPDLDYSKANMARLCGLLMDDLGFSRYAVLGHSMGGEVAINLALLHPQKTEQLILLNSAGLTDIQRGFSQRLPAWLIDGVFQNYVLQRLYFPTVFFDRQKAGTDVFQSFYYFNNLIPAETLQKLIQDNDSGSLKNQLADISQPVLLIWGAHDRTIPLEQGQAMDQLLPDSSLMVFEDCGHLTFLEKPTETCAALLQFLADTATDRH
ncbi:MAG: alpha/beta hydrolase [Ruminococcaceae bacterium]|nr:alpha/beta hydrolase [Oscillospiraceae bacterium]